MNDFFGRLAQRVLASPHAVGPRVPAVFEPPPEAWPRVSAQHEPQPTLPDMTRASGPAPTGSAAGVPARIQSVVDPVSSSTLAPEVVTLRAAGDEPTIRPRVAPSQPHVTAGALPAHLAAPTSLAPLLPRLPQPRTTELQRIVAQRAARADAAPFVAGARTSSVQVSIGRVEVRANLVKEPAAKAKQTAATAGPTLGEYLRRNAGDGT